MNRAMVENLIAGEIKIVPHEGSIPPALFRFTSRRRQLKRADNAMFYQVEIFSLMAPVKACVYVKGNTQEASVRSIVTLWGTGALNALLSSGTQGSTPSTCPTLSEYSKDIYTPDGRYVKRLSLQEKTISVKDLKAYQSAMNVFCSKYGWKRLDEFNDVTFLETIVMDYKLRGRRGNKKEFSELKNTELSTARVKNILLIVSRVFEFAIDDRLITANPMHTAIHLLPGKNSEKSFAIIPVEVEARIFSDATLWDNDYLVYAMLLLLDLTGMRLGEAMALTASDIDFDSRIISVTKNIKDGKAAPTKTRTERIVPICSLLQKLLEPLVLTRRGYIFSLKGERPYSRSKYALPFESILGKVGLPKKKRQEGMIVLHSFRHSFISHLVAKNVSDTNISLITGHDTQTLSSMNMRYTQQLMEAFPHIIEAIESIYDQETTLRIEKTIDELMPEYWKKLVQESKKSK